MFPGYLFVKFVYSTQHRAVESSHGIRGIVRFGDRLATLPEETVAALLLKTGSDEVVTVDSSPKIGDPVQIVEGPFQGLEVVVTQLLPAKERIRALLEFLGRPLEMESPQQKCYVRQGLNRRAQNQALFYRYRRPVGALRR